MSEERKKPEKKVQVGKISVTLWRKSITRKDGSVVELQRACIQHSQKRKDNSEWVNQQIWLGIDELRQVAEALDAIGEEQSSPSSSSEELSSSVRVHKIVEYIKLNSLDAGLEVLDVDEKSVSEMLSEYGIDAELTSVEERMVREELRELAEQKEFAESAYLAQCDPFLALIPERGVRRSSRSGAKFHSRGEVLVWLSRFGDISGIRRHPASA